MADAFCEFDEQLVLVSEEAEAWVRTQLDTVGLRAEPPFRFDWQRSNDDLAAGSNGFDWRIRANPDGCNYLCLFADNSVGFGSLTAFLQAYLRRFDPDGVVTVTFSRQCSPPRQTAFSGGALCVTADEINSFDADDWAEAQVSRFQNVVLPARRLARKAEELGIDAEQLDDLVHDQQGETAAGIDNDGLEAQLAFLVERCGVEFVEAELYQLALAR